MKIALVTYALEIGGVESMLHLLSGYFRAKHQSRSLSLHGSRGSTMSSVSHTIYNRMMSYSSMMPRLLRVL